jgi:hypothetical protein
MDTRDVLGISRSCEPDGDLGHDDSLVPQQLSVHPLPVVRYVEPRSSYHSGSYRRTLYGPAHVAQHAPGGTSGSAVTLRELLGLQRNEVEILLLLCLSEPSFTAQLDKLV